MATRNIVPRATGEGKLGTTSKQWGEIHCGEIFGLGSIPVGSIIAWLGGSFADNANGTFSEATINGTAMTSDANINGFLAGYGFLQCNGQLVNESGTPFNTRYVPKLTDDRFLEGGSYTGAGGDSVGGSGGESSVTLTTAQMPVHGHSYNNFLSNGSSPTGGVGGYYSTSCNNFRVNTGPTGNAGSGAPHENRPKYLTVHYIIRYK